MLFKGAQKFRVGMWAVCCIFMSHNPYGVLPHYKRHVYEPSHSCTHRFSHMSTVFLIRLVSALRITVHHWTNLRTSLVPVSQANVDIQPTLKSSRSNKPKHATITICQIREMCSCNMLWCLNQGFWTGYERWRRTKINPQRSPKIQGTYNIQILSSLWDRKKQVDSIPDTLWLKSCSVIWSNHCLTNTFVIQLLWVLLECDLVYYKAVFALLYAHKYI